MRGHLALLVIMAVALSGCGDAASPGSPSKPTVAPPTTEEGPDALRLFAAGAADPAWTLHVEVVAAPAWHGTLSVIGPLGGMGGIPESNRERVAEGSSTKVAVALVTPPGHPHRYEVVAAGGGTVRAYVHVTWIEEVPHFRYSLQRTPLPDLQVFSSQTGGFPVGSDGRVNVRADGNLETGVTFLADGTVGSEVDNLTLQVYGPRNATAPWMRTPAGHDAERRVSQDGRVLRESITVRPEATIDNKVRLELPRFFALRFDVGGSSGIVCVEVLAPSTPATSLHLEGDAIGNGCSLHNSRYAALVTLDEVAGDDTLRQLSFHVDAPFALDAVVSIWVEPYALYDEFGEPLVDWGTTGAYWTRDLRATPGAAVGFSVLVRTGDTAPDGSLTTQLFLSQVSAGPDRLHALWDLDLAPAGTPSVDRLH